MCALIPTFDNPDTIARVVAGVRRHLPDVLVVDDGSGPAARAVLATLEGCTVLRRPKNAGKGAAIKDGLNWAAAHGFDQAVAIDADLQHDPDDIPRLLAAASPGTLVLGQPIFDASAPMSRRIGRLVSVFWVMVETLGRKIGDPLCGFRVYPVAAALATRTRGDAMDFDPEIAVRLVWAGVAVAKVPTRVAYPADGVSHFRGLRDTLLISLAHSRLCLEAMGRALGRGARKLFRG